MNKLTKFEVDVSNISALSDYPNANDGMTSMQLKETYDKAGNDIKDFINNTLTEEIDLKAEEDANTYATKDELRDLQLGQLIDGTVTIEKLSEDVQERINKVDVVEENSNETKENLETLTKDTNSKLDNIYKYTIPKVEQVKGGAYKEQILTTETLNFSDRTSPNDFLHFNLNSPLTDKNGEFRPALTFSSTPTVCYDGSTGNGYQTVDYICQIMARTSYSAYYYVNNFSHVIIDLKGKRSCQISTYASAIRAALPFVVYKSEDNETWTEFASYTDKNPTFTIKDTNYIKLAYPNMSGFNYLTITNITGEVEVPNNTNFFTLPYNLENLNKNQRVLLETPSKTSFDETVFNNATTLYISTTKLDNGNVLIAYQDGGNSNYGTFIILDEDGNIIKDKTVFNSGTTDYISSIKLNNGKVLIAYRDSTNAYGMFIILDENGNIVKEKTTFNSNTIHISSTLLSNGNVLIAYTDSSNSSYGTFIIIDQDGNIIVDETVFNNSGTTEYISSAKLNNGNIIIVYRDYSDSSYNGSFVILDENGNIVKDKTIFHSGTTDYISSIKLNNGNVLIAYRDIGNSNYGTFMIIDEDGNIIKDKTVFNSATTIYISTTKLDNGNVLIAYGDGGSYYGGFIIIDENGTIVKDKTVFNNISTTHTSSITLDNGNVLIAYYNGGSCGEFAIVDFEKLNYMYTIDGVTGNKLNNIPVENILLPSTKYELVYDGEKFVDNTNKILYDITFTEEVYRVDLPGIVDMLQVGKLYACIVMGSTSTAGNILLGNTTIGYLRAEEDASLGLFIIYDKTSSACYIKPIYSNNSNVNSTASGNVTISSERIQQTNGYKFSIGTRIIIKEIG